eukprot:CAMPEP_0182817924 /NCGR_PEP_ID=MMETSP0006_2-20121128/11740_1 /TAXON_ID=97485 /ORGANISM="Prymnesium parvum, Strain Texoma1" /LENGTH=195 /DNA_ID=CAMNT_0024944335 /DNA_START=121 /DNA_END=708 /DNA_ORIENTATION=+
MSKCDALHVQKQWLSELVTELEGFQLAEDALDNSAHARLSTPVKKKRLLPQLHRKKPAQHNVARLTTTIDPRMGHVGITVSNAPHGPGVRVDHVVPPDLAARAGLQKGDVIISINGVTPQHHGHAIALIEGGTTALSIVFERHALLNSPQRSSGEGDFRINQRSSGDAENRNTRRPPDVNRGSSDVEVRSSPEVV